MNLYESDLKNLEKRAAFRHSWRILDFMYGFVAVFLVLTLTQDYLGYWLSLIPGIFVAFLYQMYASTRIQSCVDEMCKKCYPLSYDLLSEVPENSETKTEENPVQ